MPYDYLLDAKTNGFKVASENLIKSILIGDLVYDILATKLSAINIVENLKEKILESLKYKQT